ncbi:MAG: hypothetical protein HJJLKODD_02167 [Phycisphaerae bacterium]|nr:hypothetical protein [Phycisphaerae bacterium]
MADYIPTEEAALVIWASDHAAGVATHGTTVGLAAADITQAATDAATIAHAVNGRSLYESKKQEFTAYKDILLHAPLNTPLPTTPAAPAVGALGAGAQAACIAHARQRAERIKAHPNYTVAIGEDCRIVAPSGASAVAPITLKAVEETGFAVKLTFAMRGHDQIEIVSQRAAETVWASLAFDTNSPYLDARAPLVANQPEVRRYRARYRDDDQPVGDWSDIVQVTARP